MVQVSSRKKKGHFFIRSVNAWLLLTSLKAVIGRDTFSVLAPVLGPWQKKAVSPSSIVHGGKHDTKYVTFELLLHAAFVTDEIRRFTLEPALTYDTWIWRPPLDTTIKSALCFLWFRWKNIRYVQQYTLSTPPWTSVAPVAALCYCCWCTLRYHTSADCPLTVKSFLWKKMLLLVLCTLSCCTATIDTVLLLLLGIIPVYGGRIPSCVALDITAL